MGGKSIGFITLKAHTPTDEEIMRRPELSKVRRIVDEWLLVKYSCCWMPVNPEVVVEATAKALSTAADLLAFGIEPPPEPPARAIPFTPLVEVEKAIHRAVEEIDLTVLAAVVRDACHRARGGV